MLADTISGTKAALLGLLLAEWNDLGSYRESDIPRWLGASLPLIQEAEEIVANASDAEAMLMVNSLLGEQDFSDIDITSVTGKAVRLGVPPEIVYARPIKQVWHSLGQGNPMSVALQRGATRLEETVSLDLARAADLAAIERYANHNRLVGYKRVLNGTNHCALCIVASTQLYHRRELKGIHPHCNCTTRPVISSSEVSRVLDQNLLDQVHSEIAKRFGISDRAARQIDYRKIMLTRQHGEYGPTLTYSSDRFTGPRNLNPETPIQSLEG